MKRKMMRIAATTLAVCALLVCMSVGASAAKKDVYVLSKCVLTDESGDYTHTYTQNKNGLLTKVKIDSLVTNYSYKNHIIKKSIEKYQGAKVSTTTYTVKNKKLVKSVYKQKNFKMTSNYTYKNGHISKEVTKGKGFKSIINFAYNNQGLVAKRTVNYKSDDYAYKVVFTYTYDEKGNPILLTCTEGDNEVIKNTYTDGLLTKKEVTTEHASYSYTYTYKKIKVPAAYAKEVKAQNTEIVRNGTSLVNY